MIDAVKRAMLAVTVPASRIIGKTGAPWATKKITAQQYYLLSDALAPGDVLLSHADGHMSNLFIPGFWKHAAMFVGNRPDCREAVIEATGDGVMAANLVQFAMRKDYIAVYRPRFCGPMQWAAASEIAWAQHGKPYDYKFSTAPDAFYCAELVWYAYNQVCPNLMKFELRERMGSMTVTPQDFADATASWECVFDSRL